MVAGALSENKVFAGNRARGQIALSVTAARNASHRTRLHEAGSLRMRFPHGERGGTLDGVIINTAGGMAGGDRFAIDITVDEGAALAVTTAAAEKIYRSHGPDTQADLVLTVGAGGALAWLPQETILFDRARLNRTIDIKLAANARLTLLEAIIFGRSAMGETVDQGALFDRWRMRVDGRLAFAETMRLEGAIAEQLSRRAVGGSGIAVATLLRFPGDEAAVDAVRALEKTFVGEVGISAWNGLMLARLVAPDGAALRRDLIEVLAALGGSPPPRLWLN